MTATNDGSGTVMPDSLPSVEEMSSWQANLIDPQRGQGLEHLWKKLGVTDAVIKDCGLGEDRDRITVPIYEETGELVNIARLKFLAHSRGRHTRTLMGRGSQFYPWHKIHSFDPTRPVVITMGLRNCLSLLSIGCNAVTVIAKTTYVKADMIPRQIFVDGAEIVICADRTGSGDSFARKMLLGLQEFLPETTIRWVSVPTEDKMIHRHLARLPVDSREEAWGRLLDMSQAFEGREYTHASIFENNGEMFRRNGKEDIQLAPFTGLVSEHGLEKRAGVVGGRVYLLQLKHHAGSTLEVLHRQEGLLRDEIANTPGAGPEWNFVGQNSETVFNFIAQKSGLSPSRRDYGWHFGFIGDDWSKFYSQDVIIDADGSHPNEQFRMEGGNRFLEALKLPPADPEKAKEGLALLWRQAFKSHQSFVMAPLLIAAVMAPLRRMLAPTEAPFLLFVRGQTGCCKTTRVKVFQSLYGDFWNPQALLTFKSTPKFLEKFISLCGDSYVVIDELDYNKLDQREQADVKRYLQGTAQGGGRDRLDQSGNLRTSSAIEHAIKVVTCEQLPEGDQSLIARSLVVQVPAIEPLKDEWKVPHDAAEEGRHLLPYVLSNWIQWAVGNPGLAEDRYKEFFSEAESRMVRACEGELGEDWNAGLRPNLTRVYSRLKVFTAFWHLFVDWTRQAGAITLPEIDDLEDEWDLIILPYLLKVQIEALGEGGQANDMISALDTAVASGNAVFVDETSGDGSTVPSRAKQNADVIGVLKIVDGKNPLHTDNAVGFMGRMCVVCLNAGAARVIKGASWARIKNYLVDNQMGVWRRTSRGRFLVCQKDLALKLMGSVDNHYLARRDQVLEKRRTDLE